MKTERIVEGIMKRLVAIVLAALLLVSGVVLLAGAGTGDQKLVITVDAPNTAQAGSEITVSVKFSENTGFGMLGVKLNYPEGFTFVSAEPSSLIKNNFQLEFAGFSGPAYEFANDAQNNTLTFAGAGLTNVTLANGTVYTATFKADSGIANGNYNFTVEYTDNIYSNTSDEAFAGSVNAALGNGTVSVGTSQYEKGDVDKNGTINFIDAMKILRYASGLETPTDEQAYLANINGDDSINFLDAMLCLKLA